MRKIAAILALLSTTSFAGEGNVLEQMNNCRQISDKLDRLICYDKLAESVQKVEVKVQQPKVVQVKETVVKPTTVKQEAVKKATPVVATDSKSVEEIKKKQTIDFGKKETEEKLVTKVYYEVAKVKKNAFGNKVIYFNNEQVWKQIESKYYRLTGGDKVYIEDGAFGSFWLGQDGRAKRIRVKRVK